ncbi:hypothetical protein [Nocardioides psychrotolerans]|uniref:hypothetical protein n=1 Tax=Nocardioides psychrotolerans TaxID=1005945 RepID=UPI00313829FA
MTATSSRPSSSSTPAVLGVLVGLVLLAAVVAFAVLLPRAHGSADTDLPATLPGGLTATDVLDESQGDPAAAQDFADQQRELMASAEDRLEAVYDVPAHARTYQDPERGVQVTVMVLEQAAGPFVPDGPPVDPSLLGNARNQTDLVQVGEGTCSLIWQQPVPAGEPITEPDPQAVKCQVGGDESTYQLIGVGITAQEGVEILEGLLG